MKTNSNRWPAALALLGLLVLPGQAMDDAALQKLTNQVQRAVELFQAADSGMKQKFETAAGYALFPSVGKGGLGLGGAHGRGLVYEKGRLIGSASLSQFTIGAQIGGQEFAEVIFFENQGALDRFKNSRWEMSAQVSAVVAAEGAASNARYVLGVMIFTKPLSGFMAEASVGGQKFKFAPLAVKP